MNNDTPERNPELHDPERLCTCGHSAAEHRWPAGRVDIRPTPTACWPCGCRAFSPAGGEVTGKAWQPRQIPDADLAALDDAWGRYLNDSAYNQIGKANLVGFLGERYGPLRGHIAWQATALERLREAGRQAIENWKAGRDDFSLLATELDA